MNKSQKLLALTKEALTPAADTLQKFGAVYRLEKELVLKSRGSKFIYPKGTIVALLPGKKPGTFSGVNSKLDVDALSGSVNKTSAKKVDQSGKFLGIIPDNAKLLKKEIMFLVGPIAQLLKDLKLL